MEKMEAPRRPERSLDDSPGQRPGGPGNAKKPHPLKASPHPAEGRVGGGFQRVRGDRTAIASPGCRSAWAASLYPGLSFGDPSGRMGFSWDHRIPRVSLRLGGVALPWAIIRRPFRPHGFFVGSSHSQGAAPPGRRRSTLGYHPATLQAAWVFRGAVFI